MVVNLGLVAILGGVHTVMALESSKQWWIRFVPEATERSTFLQQSSLPLALAMWQWRPLAATIWLLEGNLSRIVSYIIFAMGKGMILLSTFLIDHLELFGLQQVYRHKSGDPMPSDCFNTLLLYRSVRHPMQLHKAMKPKYTIDHRPNWVQQFFSRRRRSDDVIAKFGVMLPAILALPTYSS